MPAVSAKQYGAMAAAAAGKSKKGIPKKVGKEFVKATSTVKRKAFMASLKKQKHR